MARLTAEPPLLVGSGRRGRRGRTSGVQSLDSGFPRRQISSCMQVKNVFLYQEGKSVRKVTPASEGGRFLGEYLNHSCTGYPIRAFKLRLHRLVRPSCRRSARICCRLPSPWGVESFPQTYHSPGSSCIVRCVQPISLG